MRSSTASKILLCSLLLACAVAPAKAEQASWKSADHLVDSFVELAMKNSYSTRRNPVRKWVGGVRYFIVHRVGDADLHRQLVDAQFLHLAQITGLSIQPADSRATANFLVVLTSQAVAESELPGYLDTSSAFREEMLFRHSPCLVSYGTEPRGSIVRALALIPVDAARARSDLAACVVEELTHAMGLGNDTLKPLPSIFSRRSNLAFLSGLDHLLLKMLYDPRIKPGMTEKAALPVLRVIAREYERDQVFAAAERVAAEGGLAGMAP